LRYRTRIDFAACEPVPVAGLWSEWRRIWQDRTDDLCARVNVFPEKIEEVLVLKGPEYTFRPRKMGMNAQLTVRMRLPQIWKPRKKNDHQEKTSAAFRSLFGDRR
jgi:hypothetical protein